MWMSWPAILVCLSMGICLAHFQAWLWSAALVAAGLAAGTIWTRWRPHLAVGLLAVGVGILLCSWGVPPAPLGLEEQSRFAVSGRIESIPYYDGENTVFIVDTDDSSPYKRRLRVVCLFAADFQRGAQVHLEGKLKPPRAPGNPGQFDFQSYLANQGIYYNLHIKETTGVRLLSPASGLIRRIDCQRVRAESLTRQVLPAEEAAILLGMIWGGRAGMDDQQYEDFQKTGIVHLFSVSGLHVGFLLVLINWLVSLAGAGPRGRFIAGVSGLLLYGTMVGWPPPVTRAVLMGSLGLLAYLSGRENGLLNALSISGVVMLLAEPSLLFNLSFQLTMLATGGLVYLFPQMRAFLPGGGWLKDLVLIPLSAELAILPLVAYHFNILTPGSIVTNIAAAYLAGAAVILGFIASLLAGLSPTIASVFLYPAGMFIEWILSIVAGVKALPGAYLYVATPSVTGVSLYYAIMALVLVSLRVEAGRVLFRPAVGLLLIWVTILVIPAQFYDRGQAEVVFIDVGQGDAILVKSPGGKFILVDGGGSQFFDVGADVVLPYLHHRGIRKLDMVISTHPDVDHVQGLVKVIAAMPVTCLGLPVSLAGDEDYRELNDIAAKQQIQILYMYAGQSIKLEEGFRIDVIHPPRETGSSDPNRDSAVLLISYQRFTVLLTADVSAADLASIGDRVGGPVTILKIPHHGSKGSLGRDFYEQVKPAAAVISVGADNNFGHPHPLVLTALEETGIRIMRTDLQGLVAISSNGREYQIHTQISSQL
ncbi:MAG: DNA internalization-related competence protein ComEC/Rec2 [Syntrophomonadaceae bacterium]